jgi:hypothetical protein
MAGAEGRSLAQDGNSNDSPSDSSSSETETVETENDSGRPVGETKHYFHGR